MLVKSERLSRAEFLSFFKAGKRTHTEHLTLVFVPYPTFHGSVVVSKKVSNFSVTRNTIRRRIYSELRTLRLAHPGVYIVVVKPGFATLTKKAMWVEITALIVRIKKPA